MKRIVISTVALLVLLAGSASAADATVANAAELRAAVGYWDDSEGVRVAGTAVAGDTVTLTGTAIDLGADDDILYPAAGVRITGPGKDTLTVQGRLFCLGTGGVAVATRLDGWTLDVAGKEKIPTGDAPAGGLYGGCVLADVSIVAKDWSVINSSPGVNDGNTLTCVSQASVTAVEMVFVDCVFTGAKLDTVSTKGDGSGNASAVIRFFDCTITEPGTGATDQAITTHEAVPVYMYGGTLSGNAVGYDVAAAADAATSPIYLTNVTISGRVAIPRTITGCVIDSRGKTPAVLVSGAGITTTITETKVSGFDTGNTTDYGIQYQDVGVLCVVSDTWILAVSTGYGLKSGGSGTTVTATNVCIENSYRGVDCSQPSTLATLTNCAIEASQFSAHELNPPTNLIVSNVIANKASVYGAITAHVGFEQADLDAVSALCEPLVQPQPFKDAIWKSLLRRSAWVGGGGIIGGGVGGM